MFYFNLTQDRDIETIKIDISDRESLTKAFTDFMPNKVINLAAQAGVQYSIKNPYAYMDSNLVGFLNIIELCRQNEVEGLIYASSSSVYGANKKIPFCVKDRVDEPIALDIESNNPIFLKVGRYGPYLQCDKILQ